MSRIGLSALALLGLALPASAAEEVVIDSRIPEGQRMRTEVRTETEQTLTLAGMPIPSKTTQMMIILSEPAGDAGEGEHKTRSWFDAFQQQLSVAGIEMQFDKGNPKDEAPIPQLKPVADLLRALSEAKWVSTQTDNGTVKALEFEGFPFANLPDGARGEITPERMMNQANQIAKRLPEKPVNVGDSWTRSETMPLEAGQTLTFEKEFTFRGPVENTDPVVWKIEMRHKNVDFRMAADSPSPVKISNSELKVSKTDGEILYDPAAKRIVASREVVTLEGKLGINVNGMDLPGELKLTLDFNTKAGMVPAPAQ